MKKVDMVSLMVTDTPSANYTPLITRNRAQFQIPSCNCLDIGAWQGFG